MEFLVIFAIFCAFINSQRPNTVGIYAGYSRGGGGGYANYTAL